MSTKTQAELVDEILQNLGILAVGQTATPEDTQRITERLPSIIKMLAATEVAYIPNIEVIDESIFTPLADICAYECRQKFGVTEAQQVADLLSAHNGGISRLKVIYRGRPTYKILQTEYF